MKKITDKAIYLSVIFILCVLMVKIYKKDSTLIQELHYLENEIVTLQQTNKTLLSDLENTKNELQILKDSPTNLIVEIRKEYENENYFKVKYLAEKLHNIANGTEFDLEAQSYLKKIDEIESKNNLQKAKEIIEITSTSVKKNYAYYFNENNNYFENMSIGISYKINTNEPVLTVDFSISALNSNGEVINFNTNSSRTKDITTLLFPATNTNCTSTFDKAWDNLAIKKIIVNSITITYSDGSSDLLEHLDGLNYTFVKHTLPQKNIVSNSNNSTAKQPEKIIETVYITSSGSKYHKSSCSYLKSKISIDKDQAIKKGYSACSKCNP